MGTEPAQHVRKNTPLTENLETGTCCCPSETRKGPLDPKKPQTNFPFVSPLPTVRAPDTEPPVSHYRTCPYVPEQAGFRPGKSCTAQVLNLTQHIEDGFETGKITGIVLVDLSAAYDTVNHRRLLEKVYNITRDYHLMCMIRTLLENRRFFVELGGERSRWRSQRNGLPQGSVLAPLLFNVYTDDQSIHPGTRSFVYADDLAVTTQSTDFAPIEETLTSALGGLSEYYTTNQLRANPTKTQVSLFHLRNRECGKQLNINWNGVDLTHCNLPVYLGVTLDRTLSYKAHIENIKKKVGTRNNIIRKLRTSKWGATPTTLRSSALALCYSAAEYACPVWERSTHAKKLDPTLNETCRMITGCLKPTNTNSLSVLAGIAPSDTRRAVANRTERTRQATDERHPLNGHLGVVPRLKSRKSLIKSTESINTNAKAARLELWRDRLEPLDARVHLDISADEHLLAGADNPCTTWKALNRLRTQVGWSRVNMLKWGFFNEPETCSCHLIHHLSSCYLIQHYLSYCHYIHHLSSCHWIHHLSSCHLIHHLSS